MEKELQFIPLVKGNDQAQICADYGYKREDLELIAHAYGLGGNFAGVLNNDTEQAFQKKLAAWSTEEGAEPLYAFYNTNKTKAALVFKKRDGKIHLTYMNPELAGEAAQWAKEKKDPELAGEAAQWAKEKKAVQGKQVTYTLPEGSTHCQRPDVTLESYLTKQLKKDIDIEVPADQVYATESESVGPAMVQNLLREAKKDRVVADTVEVAPSYEVAGHQLAAISGVEQRLLDAKKLEGEGREAFLARQKETKKRDKADHFSGAVIRNLHVMEAMKQSQALDAARESFRKSFDASASDRVMDKASGSCTYTPKGQKEALITSEKRDGDMIMLTVTEAGKRSTDQPLVMKVKRKDPKGPNGRSEVWFDCIVFNRDGEVTAIYQDERGGETRLHPDLFKSLEAYKAKQAETSTRAAVMAPPSPGAQLHDKAACLRELKILELRAKLAAAEKREARAMKDYEQAVALVESSEETFEGQAHALKQQILLMQDQLSSKEVSESIRRSHQAQVRSLEEALEKANQQVAELQRNQAKGGEAADTSKAGELQAQLDRLKAALSKQVEALANHIEGMGTPERRNAQAEIGRVWPTVEQACKGFNATERAMEELAREQRHDQALLYKHKIEKKVMEKTHDLNADMRASKRKAESEREDRRGLQDDVKKLKGEKGAAVVAATRAENKAAMVKWQAGNAQTQSAALVEVHKKAADEAEARAEAANKKRCETDKQNRQLRERVSELQDQLSQAQRNLARSERKNGARRLQQTPESPSVGFLGCNAGKASSAVQRKLDMDGAGGPDSKPALLSERKKDDAHVGPATPMPQIVVAHDDQENRLQPMAARGTPKSSHSGSNAPSTMTPKKAAEIFSEAYVAAGSPAPKTPEKKHSMAPGSLFSSPCAVQALSSRSHENQQGTPGAQALL